MYTSWMYSSVKLYSLTRPWVAPFVRKKRPKAHLNSDIFSHTTALQFSSYPHRRPLRPVQYKWDFLITIPTPPTSVCYPFEGWRWKNFTSFATVKYRKNNTIFRVYIFYSPLGTVFLIFSVVDALYFFSTGTNIVRFGRV